MKFTEWLYRANVKVSSVARKMDIHPSYLFQLMSGRRSPSAKVLIKIQEITMDMVQTKEDLIDERRVKCVDKRMKTKGGAKLGAKISMPVRGGKRTIANTSSGKKNKAISKTGNMSLRPFGSTISREEYDRIFPTLK